MCMKKIIAFLAKQKQKSIKLLLKKFLINLPNSGINI